jgi:hypothetical protein
MTYQKISCSESLNLFECINPRRNRWAVRWRHEADSEGNYTAYETVFDYKPTIDEITAIVVEQIDAETADIITNNFTFNGKQVKLTDTTQRNFLLAAYVSKNTGEIDMQTFAGIFEAETEAQAADELEDFVSSMWAHIRDARIKGIRIKESIDFSAYES